MLEAGSQCMDLQSLRDRRGFVFAPSDDFGDPHRRHQILLQCGQHGIGADLDLGVAAMIVTAGQSQPGDGDKESGETRQLCRACNLRVRVMSCLQRDGDLNQGRANQPVRRRTRTTSPEGIRPVGTTAV